ncbi:hypothetical protein BLNAU_14825 [Blattamonas nauphoetae]|uniref:Cyclophilin-like domain-containing protein n=1 Tax=Blattamonas nauphoetae TaxID=2049346 RepID=A0ABQ9XCK2_9EUKA|nr:hypothetical protein BLNAU_14825 [Blattamonas nauphoetae]
MLKFQGLIHRGSCNVYMEEKFSLTFGSHTYTFSLFDNTTGQAFKNLLPLTLSMTDVNSNEKFIRLPQSLPQNEASPGQINSGDIYLYGSNGLVLFYKSFPTSYSYTGIGTVDSPESLETALGTGTVSITFRSQADPVQLILTYDINGGTGTIPERVAGEFGSNITLHNGSGFVRTNHTFVGWCTSENGTGTNYSTGSIFTLTSNTILYAKWNAASTGNFLRVRVNSSTFSGTFGTSEAATAFKAMLPMTLDMSELNGNEKYADLSESIPTNATNPRTIQNGDLMLYGSRTVVLFYKSFPTSHSYTQLPQIQAIASVSETYTKPKLFSRPFTLQSHGILLTFDKNEQEKRLLIFSQAAPTKLLKCIYYQSYTLRQNTLYLHNTDTLFTIIFNDITEKNMALIKSSLDGTTQEQDIPTYTKHNYTTPVRPTRPAPVPTQAPLVTHTKSNNINTLCSVPTDIYVTTLPTPRVLHTNPQAVSDAFTQLKIALSEAENSSFYSVLEQRFVDRGNKRKPLQTSVSSISSNQISPGNSYSTNTTTPASVSTFLTFPAAPVTISSPPTLNETSSRDSSSISGPTTTFGVPPRQNNLSLTSFTPPPAAPPQTVISPPPSQNISTPVSSSSQSAPNLFTLSTPPPAQSTLNISELPSLNHTSPQPTNPSAARSFHPPPKAGSSVPVQAAKRSPVFKPPPLSTSTPDTSQTSRTLPPPSLPRSHSTSVSSPSRNSFVFSAPPDQPTQEQFQTLHSIYRTIFSQRLTDKSAVDECTQTFIDLQDLHLDEQKLVNAILDANGVKSKTLQLYYTKYSG